MTTAATTSKLSFAVKLQDQEVKMAENRSPDELDLEIMTCSIKRLSTKETLEDLHSKGYEIEERAYYTRKKKLKAINIKRVTSAIEGLVAQHFRMIDSLELIQKNLWKDLDKVTDPNLRLKIMNAIRENQNYLLEYYELIPTLVENQIKSFNKMYIVQEIEYKIHKIRDRIRSIQHTLSEDDRDPFQEPSFFPVKLSEKTTKKFEDELRELELKNQKITQDNDDNQSNVDEFGWML